MAKKQDFATKLAKGKKRGETCPVCGNIFTLLKKVESYKTEMGTWRYRTTNLKVCQCNEKEVYT